MWIAAIQPLETEDDVPFSYVQAEGLSPRSRVPLSESQNLRRLKTSVSGLRAGRLNASEYADEIGRVLEMTEQKWLALEALGESEIVEAAGLCLQQLFLACELMLDQPEVGLEGALEAFEAIDRLEAELLQMLAAC